MHDLVTTKCLNAFIESLIFNCTQRHFTLGNTKLVTIRIEHENIDNLRSKVTYATKATMLVRVAMIGDMWECLCCSAF